MQVAEHGATFPKAKQLRASMTHEQLHDFAAGSEKGKPERVAHPHRLAGTHDGMYVTSHHRGAKKR